jgi:hypothetical protein
MKIMGVAGCSGVIWGRFRMMDRSGRPGRGLGSTPVWLVLPARAGRARFWPVFADAHVPPAWSTSVGGLGCGRARVTDEAKRRRQELVVCRAACPRLRECRQRSASHFPARREHRLATVPSPSPCGQGRTPPFHRHRIATAASHPPAVAPPPGRLVAQSVATPPASRCSPSRPPRATRSPGRRTAARALTATAHLRRVDQVLGQGAGGTPVACWIAVIRSSARSMATGRMLPLKPS